MNASDPEKNFWGDINVPFALSGIPGRMTRTMGYGPSRDNNEPIVDIRPRVEASGEEEDACPFGQVFLDDTQWKIRGGPLVAGEDVYAIDDEDFSVGSDIDTLYWIEVSFEANADIAAERLFGGILSSSTPAWNSGASYPDQTVPTGADPTGEAIIPIGRLIVTDGVPSFSPARGCGTITVSHCPGSVTH